MDETTKSKKLWGELEKSVVIGKGIDIGCGPDPIAPDVRRFDISDGDANEITKYVHDEFDFVYASHCLEHMHNPSKTLLDWWKLVRVGGHIFFTVPDEDLYEQGVFPSRYNPDHKATFTISKAQSWSPVSLNVLDLARSLPSGELVSLVLHDHGYDRRLLTHGQSVPGFFERFLFKIYNAVKRRTGIKIGFLEKVLPIYTPVDQTTRPNAMAQIQCIVKKLA